MSRPRAGAFSAEQVARAIGAVAPGIISAQEVGYHRAKSRWSLGVGGSVNPLIYAAWLRRLRVEGQRLKPSKGALRTQATVMAARRKDARDIGEEFHSKPKRERPKLYKACRLDLKRFLVTYMPHSFPLEFSADHNTVVAVIQRAVLEGGLELLAVYRGFGKTTICIGAAIWAVLYGHKRYLPIVCSDMGAAEDLITKVLSEFENNSELMRDFRPECFPFYRLDGIPHRCAGQLLDGKRTLIAMKRDTLILPTTDLNPESAGVILKSFGLTGRLRGIQHKIPTGEVLRPDFVLIDDPQTDQSARSPSQCALREKIIIGTILGMAGHTRPISAVMPSTVIERDDLIDRLLDHDRHAEWQGVRIKMVRKWPDAHETRWLKEYADIRRRYIPDDHGGRALAEQQATGFYSQHRAEMDAGAEISWPECKHPGELSALQHAYNLLIDRGERAFMAEYQLEPLAEDGIEAPLLPWEIASKLNRLGRLTVGSGASVVVGFVDVGAQSAVHWLVCWFGDGFSGGVCDAGVMPVARTAGGGVEAAVYGAVRTVTDALCGRVYPVAGGGAQRISLCPVDSGWQTATVYAACQQSQHAALLLPSKGQGAEVDLRAPKICARRDKGDGWFCAPTRERRDVRLLSFETDRWKSFAAERLRTPLGGRGCVSLWGDSAAHHRVLADHFTAEQSRPKRKRDGTIFAKWTLKRGRENHYWDCLVGCCVAAARMGITLDGIGQQRSAKPAGAGRTLAQILGRTP